MATLSNVATQILNENNYTSDDITTTNLEYLVDNAIRHINLAAGMSMALTSGTPGAKDLVYASEDELGLVKELSSLLLRAYLDKGPTVSVASLTVNAIATDPHYKLYIKLFNQGLQYLRGRSFVRT